MVFYIENKNNLPFDLLRAQLLRKARRSILFYRESTAEKLFNQYFMQNYKTNLKLMCLKILRASRVMQNYNGDVVVKIISPQLEKIARFITFGNLDYPGSKILKFAIS